MEMSCKELETKFSGDIKKRELELISIIIRKVRAKSKQIGASFVVLSLRKM